MYTSSRDCTAPSTRRKPLPFGSTSSRPDPTGSSLGGASPISGSSSPVDGGGLLGRVVLLRRRGVLRRLGRGVAALPALRLENGRHERLAAERAEALEAYLGRDRVKIGERALLEILAL